MRRLVARVASAGLVTGGLVLPPAGAVATPAARQAEHLEAIVRYRSEGGLGPVRHQPDLQRGVTEHARYLQSGWSDLGTPHRQDPTRADASTAGGRAAMASVIDVTPGRVAHTSPVHVVDRLAAAAFHAPTLLSPTWRGTAVAEVNLGERRSVTVLDVLSEHDRTGGYPVVSPGDGATTRRHTYGGREWPDPLAGCPGIGPPSGHPVLLLQGPDGRAAVTTSLEREGRPVDHCTIDWTTYRNRDEEQQRLGRASLRRDRTIVLLPDAPLPPGSYTATITTEQATFRWSWSQVCLGSGPGGPPQVDDGASAGGGAGTSAATGPPASPREPAAGDGQGPGQRTDRRVRDPRFAGQPVAACGPGARIPYR